jgi:hypothetical protein
MDLLNLAISDSKGIAKQIHPSGLCPEKPLKNDFKDETKFLNAMLAYETSLLKWQVIDATLLTYPISALKCASGIMVNAKVLHWHLGGKIKAQLLEDGSVIDDGFNYTKPN